MNAYMSEIFGDTDDISDISEEENVENNLKRKHAKSPEKPNKRKETSTVVDNSKFIVITHDIKWKEIENVIDTILKLCTIIINPF